MGSQPAGLPWPANNQFAATPNPSSSFHAYLHIPFCVSRCGYCDFNTYTADELPEVEQRRFDEVLAREIAWSSEVMSINELPKRSIQTIFFGGGTPSQLQPTQIARLIDLIADTFGLASDAEITLEANPDDLNRDVLAGFRAAGVNRLSIGVQSFDTEVLRVLERRHEASKVPEVLQLASSLELRTSIDLIFGTPGESLESWEQTLATAAGLPIEHVSTYALIIEPGTKLNRQVRSGELSAQEDDVLAAKYAMANLSLTRAGFGCYEVSNFTRGEPAKHNLAYWQSQDWWGYGPGAHSHVAGFRWWNVRHPLRYSQALQAGSPAAGCETLTSEQKATERVLLGMRLREGLPQEELAALGVSSGVIETELSLGNLQRIENRLAIAEESRFLADGIILRLLASVAS